MDKKYTIVNAKITKKQNLTPTIFDFTVESETLAKSAKCGQFIHVNCGESFTLRRPISICEILPEASSIRFIFDVRGKGTEALSKLNVGDYIDILGTLGNGFSVSSKKALLLGGGIGTYPLLQLAKEIQPLAVSLGFRSKDFVTLEDEFKKYTDNLYISTDDGSYGLNGNALSAVEADLKSGKYEAVYACGPLPMLKALKTLTDMFNIECQISLEERMGCGIGACLCCAVKVEDYTELGFKHLHVCKNGPVFNAKGVIL